MRLHQLWEWIRRQVATRTTTTPTPLVSETHVQLLAEMRALSPAELAEMEQDYNPEIAGKTKADFFMDTGMTPEMYLLRLLGRFYDTVIINTERTVIVSSEGHVAIY